MDRHAEAVELNLRAGDEASLVAFLRAEVETLFEHLEGYGPEVRARIEAYRAALDPQQGAVATRRRDFETSVTMINDAILAFVEAEERAAQAACPHFFEMQRTDGVDYSIYAGGSLLEDGGFAPLHLRNLRLWQLMVACGIAAQVRALRPRLPQPLEITNLVLIQHAPLAIRFRFDEKRFDVDGAYNVRYEIMKKRIDKAVLRGTTRAADPAGQDRPRLLAAHRGRGVPRVHRLPAGPPLPHARGRAAGAGRAAGRDGTARAARHRRSRQRPHRAGRVPDERRHRRRRAGQPLAGAALPRSSREGGHP